MQISIKRDRGKLDVTAQAADTTGAKRQGGQKVLAPCTERIHPDTFCFNLTMRKSRSAKLLSNGTLNLNISAAQGCPAVGESRVMLKRDAFFQQTLV